VSEKLEHVCLPEKHQVQEDRSAEMPCS